MGGGFNIRGKRGLSLNHEASAARLQDVEGTEEEEGPRGGPLPGNLAASTSRRSKSTPKTRGCSSRPKQGVLGNCNRVWGLALGVWGLAFRVSVAGTGLVDHSAPCPIAIPNS